MTAHPNRVRHKAGYFASGTSRTVTFDEGTALDSTHLLVYIVHYSTSSAPSAPSGWTQVGSNSGNTPSMLVWLKQGDGSTNSITWTSLNGVGSAHLIAYSGYSSLTALVAFSTTQVSSAVNPWTFPDLASTTGDGVAFHLAGSSAQAMGGGTPSWTNTAEYLPVASGSARMVIAEDVYDDGTGDQSTAVTLSATRTGWKSQIVIPLVTTPPPVDATATQDLGTVEQAATATATPPTFDATATQSLGSLEQSATATHTPPTFTADASQQPGTVEQSATATHTAPTFTADASQSLGSIEQSATATSSPPAGVDATATQSLGVLGQSAAVWTGNTLDVPEDPTLTLTVPARILSITPEPRTLTVVHTDPKLLRWIDE